MADTASKRVREARAALARLEEENRAVRRQLDLVLSSKARRAIRPIAHPLWALRSAASIVREWKPIAAPRRLWRDFWAHRASLGSVAPAPSEDGLAAEWIPNLRIAGQKRQALVCRGETSFTFRTNVGGHAQLRTHCAVLPRFWEESRGSFEFVARVRGIAGETRWERSAARVLEPVKRWADRRWRPITIELPADASGDVTVTLETRSLGPAPTADAGAVWGDPALDWPRTRGERGRLLRGAVRRVRWAGLRGTLEYARGRQTVEDQAAAYRRWVEMTRLDDRSLERLRAEVEALPYRPVISIVTPVFNTPPDALTACVESVRRQAYQNWELCLADDGSTSAATSAVLQKFSDDPRVRVVTLERNANISAASNAALRVATGEFVALLDHDDELAPEALAEVVRYLKAHPEADVIYSDEDKLDESGARCDPYFKPDWSPEFFLSYMYTCHLMVVRRRAIDEAGGFRIGFEGAQDYDLLLRIMEKTSSIHHIPQILYHWRKSPASTATLGAIKPWALDAGRRALEDSVRRRHPGDEVMAGPYPGMYRVRRAINGTPLVSIVIPTTGRSHARGADLLARCLRSLQKTTWSHFEVVVAADRGDMSAAAGEALKGLRHRIVSSEPPVPFNFPHKINDAVRAGAGEHVVLFNDDLEVIAPDWLTAMLEHSQDPAVGAVGAKLLYPDGRLQHVGLLIGVCGLAAHAFHRYPGDTPGYGANAVAIRNCSAVSGACLMTRRSVFDEAGGFDEALPVDFNDVDYCLRIRAAGYRIVFTPYALLHHHESASFGQRVQSARELALMRERWGAALDSDPYYNANLSKNFSDYRLQV